MIKNSYFFPQCYVAKIPYCDECDESLVRKNVQLLVDPPSSVYVCPKCNKEYVISDISLEGEWKWRKI